MNVKQAVLLNGEKSTKPGDIARHTGQLVIHSMRLSEGNTEAWRDSKYQLEVFYCPSGVDISNKIQHARELAARHVFIKAGGDYVGAVIGPGLSETIDAITENLTVM